MDDFDAITAELMAGARMECEEQARELLDEADGNTRFVQLVGRVQTGEVVGVALLDGTMLRGRVTRVGFDWIRLAEAADEVGTARARTRRTHDIRISGISRLIRDRAQ